MVDNVKHCYRCGARAVCVNPDGPVCNEHIASTMASRIQQLEAQVADLKEEQA